MKQLRNGLTARCLLLCFPFGLTVCVGVNASAQVVADAAGNYLTAAGSPTAVLATPPTGWSYHGSTAANGAALVALTADAVGNQGAAYQGFAGVSGVGTAAVYGTNTANSPEFEIFGNGEANGAVVGTDLLLHAGQGGNDDEFVIARYTISAADALNATAGNGIISGSFRELIIGGGAAVNSISADIFQNSTNLFSVTGNQSTPNALTQAEGTFNLTGLTFAENDTIDFVVGINGHFGADETALQATISIEPQVDLLKIVANTVTGAVSLTNPSENDYAIDFYTISSDDEALSFDDWNSLEDQDRPGFPAGDGSGNGWEQSGGSDEAVLTETYLNGSSVVTGGESIPLGLAFDESVFGSGNDGDLTFRYRLAGSGQIITGDVEYVSTVLQGDFNVDGVVDSVDYTVWRDNLGANDESSLNGAGSNSGGVDEADYTLWKSQFGQSAAPSVVASTAVPEPRTVTLGLFCMFAAATLAVCRRYSPAPKHSSIPWVAP